MFIPSLCQWDYWHSEELSKHCLALSRAQGKNFSLGLNDDKVSFQPFELHPPVQWTLPQREKGGHSNRRQSYVNSLLKTSPFPRATLLLATPMVSVSLYFLPLIHPIFIIAGSMRFSKVLEDHRTCKWILKVFFQLTLSSHFPSSAFKTFTITHFDEKIPR